MSPGQDGNAAQEKPLATVYVDADACPVKNEVYRVAERFRVPVILVANSPMRTPQEPWIQLVLVDGKADAADHWIVERAVPGDVIITNDILLAERLVKDRKAHPISPAGKLFTRDNIGEAVAGRELMQRLRAWGGEEGGPPPFTKGDRSRFLQVLHATLEKLQRERAGR
jgi:uncharacterized protein YaiI (UPF0178 family)